jgi:hypothetical protein
MVGKNKVEVEVEGLSLPREMRQWSLFHWGLRLRLSLPCEISTVMIH